MTSPVPYKRRVGFPQVLKGELAVYEVIVRGVRVGKLGLDLEFHSNQPTIIGVAATEGDQDFVAASLWTRELGEACVAAANSGTKLVAYSGIAADKPVLEAALGVKTGLICWIDTMVQHYIVNPDLASVAKASGGEETQDLTYAMMNIWVATSLLHDVPHWKGYYQGDTHLCANPEECLREQRPCGQHDEQAYCGIDAWAGLVIDEALQVMLPRLKIPETYYHFRAELAEYCLRMQEKGIAYDEEAAKALDAAISSKKATLFPCKFSWEPKARVVKPLKPPKPPRFKKDGTPCKVKPAKPPKEPKPPKPLKKPRVIWEGPFNPNSPQAVTTWFEAQGISLRDQGGNLSMGKAVTLKALQRRLKRYGLEFDPALQELKDCPELHDEELRLSEVDDALLRLVQKQLAGKGLKAWTDPSYVLNRRIHSRFNPCGTSMSRLSSSKPNNHNIPRVGFGAEVRKIYVADPGCQVVKADFNSLETFVALWWGRSSRSGEGVFDYLVEASEGVLPSIATQLGVAPRDLAKTCTYSIIYGEGTTLESTRDLSSPHRVRERKAGALLVNDGQDLPLWTFHGRFVCNTGSNLAERLFGDRTYAARKKALELQTVFHKLLPEIKDVFWREAVLQAEQEGCVRLPSGHRLPLYGRVYEDDFKQALAGRGQGGGAVYSQEGMLRFGRLGHVMNLQVHDEYVFTDVPGDWKEDQIAEFMLTMVQRSEILIRAGEKGFTCPAKVSYGPNWKDQRKFGVLRVGGWERL